MIVNGIRWLILGLMLALAPAAPVDAADREVVPEPVQWQQTAQQAMNLLHQRQPVPDATWSTVRDHLARQRERTLAISQSPPLEIKILTAQLSALGPPPSKDATELPWIARRRAELEGRILQARGPLEAAEGAFARTNVLIAEIDQRLERDRRKSLLTKLPSPLLPSGWLAMLSETGRIAKAAHVRILEAGTQRPGAIAFAAWPLALLLLVAGGAIAVVVQRPTIARIDQWLGQSGSPGGTVLLLILRDLASLIIPAVGLLLIMVAVPLLLPNVRVWATIEQVLALSGFVVIFAMWLGRSLFSPRLASQRFVSLDDRNARRATTLVTLLGFALAAEIVAEEMESVFRPAPAAAAIFSFLPILFSAALLLMLAHTLRRIGRGPDGEIDFRQIFVTAMRIVAVLAVLLGSSGYVTLARELMLPTLFTLSTVALSMLLYRRIILLSKTVAPEAAKRHQGARLLPVFVALLLSVMMLPLIAIFWGVRADQIGDFIAMLRDGIAVGKMRISAGDAMTFGVVFLLGYGVTRTIQRLVQQSVMQALEFEPGVQAALLTGLGYVGLTLTALIATVSAGLDLSSLAVILGALSVGAGLGLQSVVANFVSGIILLIERPIKEGDWIEVGGHAGLVARISVRSTRLRTMEQDDVIIPNSDLIGGIVRNRTYAGKMGRIDLGIGVAYGTDLERAADILCRIARECAAVEADPPPLVVLDRFDDWALELKLLCLIEDISRAPLVKSQLRFEIYRVFREEGIVIPFPQREITVRHERHRPNVPEPQNPTAQT